MSSNVVRWGGVAGVVAAGMWVLSFILIQLTSLPRVFESFSDYLIEVVLLVGYAGTMGAIVGLHALQSQSGRYGRLGTVGSLLTFIGYAIVFVVTTSSILQGGQALLNAWCELAAQNLSGRCPPARVGLLPDPEGKGTVPSCSTWTPSSPHFTSWWTTSATPSRPKGGPGPRRPSPTAR